MTSLLNAAPFLGRHSDAQGAFAGVPLSEDVSELHGTPNWNRLRPAIVSCMLEEESTPLGRLLPGLGAVFDDSLEHVRLKERSRNVLVRAGIKGWGALGQTTARDLLAWNNAGIITARDVLGACLDAAIQAATSGYSVALETDAAIEANVVALVGHGVPSSAMGVSPDDPKVSPLLEMTRTLRILAAWVASEHRVERLGEALGIVLEGHPPPDVEAALTALRDLDPALLAPSSLLQCNLDALMAELTGVLDLGQKTAFERRVIDRDATLEEVGGEMGLTRERVRQLQVAAEAEISAALKGERFRPIWWRAWDLSSVLGRAAPLDSPITEAGLAHALRGSSGQSRRVLRAVILNLAGPYRERAGWLVQNDLPAVSAAELAGLADQYGLIPMHQASAWLVEQGIRPGFHDSWLAQSRRFRREGETMLVWSRSAVDKCLALLALHNEPMDAETLLDLIGEGHNVRGIRARLFEEPRIMRVSRTRWALRAWGMEEYTGITEEIAQRIEEWGGRAKLTDLIDDLVPLFGVRGISVRTYAQAPMFVIEDGWVRMRREDEPFLARTDVAPCRGVFRTSTGVTVLTAVDGDVLRGSGRPIPAAAAALLGVLPGERRTFDHPSGALMVAWPMSAGLGPTMGSVRRLAEITGAASGDQLRLSFDADAGSVTAQRIAPGDIADLDAAEALRMICGIDDVADAEAALGVALEVAPSSVRRVLIDRGDNLVADLLPNGHRDDGLDAALNEFARLLDGIR